MQKISVLLVLLFSTHFCFSQQLQSPEDFLGYEVGTEFTRHANVVRYFESVAEASNMVEYNTYGKTNEGRPLTYAIISSPENLTNIEQIRKDHLGSAGLLENDNSASSKKAVVWLSYNVHGNEASSTEAAMKTLYELITSKKEWLKNTVVIIDPCVNPDGRDRYVNWYNMVRTTPYTANPIAVEHIEPWPGGRPNHYLFDLNRDWAWATQVETRQRLKVYNKWMPQIHVDFHEQGVNDPYYFAPAAEPFHEIITPFQRDFQTTIGKNHAKYFDKNGWLYFTKERFDLLYPSYGDTYPIYMGAIGMTYEQAGNGGAGLGINTREGFELTLVDRVAHHLTTGLSTIEVASENIEQLNSEFKSFFNNRDSKYKSYALNGEADKIAALQRLLDRHEIKYGNTNSNRIKGFNYTKNNNAGLNINAKTLVINGNQPKGKMVKVLFEPNAKLNDSLTYDITAWSLPYAYGLEAVSSSDNIKSSTLVKTEKFENTAAPSAAGYIAKWNSMDDARFLTALLKEGIKVRFSEKPLQTENEKFEAGSLVITKSDNAKFEEFDTALISIANKFNRKLSVANSGFSRNGPDFGSSDIKIINKPTVGVLQGEGTSSLSYGEILYFFEQDLQYPVFPISTNYLSNVDLAKIDVLVMPSGYYNSLLDPSTLNKLKAWVKGGGKVIAIGNAVSAFAGKEGFDLHENISSIKKDSTEKGNLLPYNVRERESIKDLITGSIVKTKVDNTNPMAFGYNNYYFSLKLSEDSYAYLNNGYNVSYLENEPQIVSGFAGSNAKEKIKNSMIFGEERMGRGSFIYLVDNPLFRSFWENGKLFFVNSLFFVNNNEYDMD
ncbi:Zinc carboxypeptidase [Gillisia sp. Hel1_33_143]|uniref:M14 family metallopeptidase n=1 Tax=Gillisia sp. Hel1_33_143 TaxID=1336796 RepID=UPI00087B6E44|nr:M14 family metallopeptidase [Gillisia sp. Hel1_33_143]SDS31111.1 Zinc carboxypeptidase [Gillisia sp. Hel1_33_143]